MTRHARFRLVLVVRDQSVGCFIKTFYATVIEVFGSTNFVFLVLDDEYPTFDKPSIKMWRLAARTVGIPLLIRASDDNPAPILNVLDCCAAGVVVPKVASIEQADWLANSMVYFPIGRGISGAAWAGAYGAHSPPEHPSAADAEVLLICQIEDYEGAENAKAIASVDGSDALFVGRADLTVSSGLTLFSDGDNAKKADKPLGGEGATTGLFVAPTEYVGSWHAKGLSLCQWGL